MKIPKRHLARMQAEEERLKRLNSMFSFPPPETPPFTDDEKRRFERMSAIMHDVIHGMSREPNLIVELVSLGHSCLPHGSMRHWNLQRKIKHYVTLEQAAAKDKLWRKMY